jgi:hypothetical protein
VDESTNKGRPQYRVRVEHGIYRQPNGKYAVCFMVDGRPRFRTVGYNLDVARVEPRLSTRPASESVWRRHSFALAVWRAGGPSAMSAAWK